MPPSSRGAGAVTYVLGVAAALAALSTLVDRATSLYDAGYGAIFIFLASGPLAFAAVRWQRQHVRERPESDRVFVAAVGLTLLLVGAGLGFTIVERETKDETETGQPDTGQTEPRRCRKPMGTLPEVFDTEPFRPARQPATGTVCLNERSTGRFDGGEFAVSLGEITNTGLVRRAVLRVAIDDPGGVTGDINCPAFLKIGNGDRLIFEWWGNDVLYLRELVVEEVHPGSALIWGAIENQPLRREEGGEGLPERLRCRRS